ncbi:hypothetical protein EAT49_01615 [Histidinibacterium lentulum]|uniref:Uncharacterized protein n=1 Tax=Histidinibacterium lentulum TaxID=2480588 RepID=A0A3N2R9H8_9RHOB|nr:hypothetical protein EAT49_01615 [Histidinibacterium lentulum]
MPGFFYLEDPRGQTGPSRPFGRLQSNETVDLDDFRRPRDLAPAQVPSPMADGELLSVSERVEHSTKSSDA